MDNRKHRDQGGGEEFTGSSTVENTREVTAGLLRMKQVSVPAFIVSERVVCVYSSSHQDDRQVGSGAQVPSLR